MRKFIGEILTEMEVTTELEVNNALAKQRDDDDRRPIGEILVEMNACQPEHVARALAEQYDMRFIDLEVMEIPQRSLSWYRAILVAKIKLSQWQCVARRLPSPWLIPSTSGLSIICAFLPRVRSKPPLPLNGKSSKPWNRLGLFRRQARPNAWRTHREYRISRTRR